MRALVDRKGLGKRRRRMMMTRRKRRKRMRNSRTGVNLGVSHVLEILQGHKKESVEVWYAFWRSLREMFA